MQDEFIPLDALDRWHHLFTHQRMIRLAGAGHLVQEDQQSTLPDLIRSFLHDEEAA